MDVAGVAFKTISYRGEGPAMKDLTGGHVDSACALAPAAIPLLEGKVRAPAGGAAGTPAVTPDVPKRRRRPRRVHFPGLERGLCPEGNARRVKAKLQGALQAAVSDPDVESASRNGLGAADRRDHEGRSPRKLVDSEMTRWPR